MTDAELHNALLLAQDREYKFVLNLLRSARYDLPAQGAMAYQWLIEAATRGDGKAQFAAAKLLCVGLYVKEDKHMARQWCERAAHQRLPEAITMLGGFHESGWGGLDADLAKAIELWSVAAQLGETGAMCALAATYIDGTSMTMDWDVGIGLLKRAADAADEIAQCKLGSMLIESGDVALEADGLRWIQAAAANHSPTAHRLLGYYYRGGQHGLPVDLGISRRHFEEADRLDGSAAQSGTS